MLESNKYSYINHRRKIKNIVLCRLVIEAVTEKVTFQRCVGGTRAGHAGILGESISGRRNSKCKGPEAGVCCYVQLRAKKAVCLKWVNVKESGRNCYQKGNRDREVIVPIMPQKQLQGL